MYMSFDNMREEHQEKLIKDAEKLAKEQEKEAEGKAKAAVGPKKDMGFIAVSIGEGVNEVFNGLGVDYLIEGGQTMNPSTEDMLNAIEHVNAEQIRHQCCCRTKISLLFRPKRFLRVFLP